MPRGGNGGKAGVCCFVCELQLVINYSISTFWIKVGALDVGWWMYVRTLCQVSVPV